MAKNQPAPPPPAEPVEEPTWLGMKIACSGLRREFKECVLNSPCVLKVIYS